jgi:hypothetical protein
MTASDLSLRGFRTMYTVDTRVHGARFQARFPSRNVALQFDVAVTHNWTVVDPELVVQHQVVDAPASCQAHLVKLLRPLFRRMDVLDEADAEQLVNDALVHSIRLSELGLMITNTSVEVRSDAEALGIKREQYTQTEHLGLHEERVRFFDRMSSIGNAAANILAADPEKAIEAATFLDGQLQRDKNVALEAMRVLLEGGGVVPGDLDGAVVAVVERFQSIVSPASGAVAGTGADPVPAALTRSASDVPGARAGADDDLVR